MLPKNLAELTGETLYTFDYAGRIVPGGVVAGGEKSACLALCSGELRVVAREDLHLTEADALRAKLARLQHDFDRANQGLRDCLHRLAEIAAKPAAEPVAESAAF